MFRLLLSHIQTLKMCIQTYKRLLHCGITIAHRKDLYIIKIHKTSVLRIYRYITEIVKAVLFTGVTIKNLYLYTISIYIYIP